MNTMTDGVTGKRGRRPGKTRPGKPVMFYIDPQMLAAVDDYLASLDPHVTRTALLESLLRAHIRDRGFWPPKAGADGRTGAAMPHPDCGIAAVSS